MKSLKAKSALFIVATCALLTIVSSCHSSRYACPTYGKANVKVVSNC